MTTDSRPVHNKALTVRGSHVSNQQVFDFVVPRILKQGRCWAPGYGLRYELMPGYYWTGARYKKYQVLSENAGKPKKRGRKEGYERVITKFPGDRVYQYAPASRYSPVRMIVPDRGRFKWDSNFEGKSCDAGRLSSLLAILKYDVEFCKSMQRIHDDLSMNTKEDWFRSFSRLAKRYKLSKMKTDWQLLTSYQGWDYHSLENREAITLYVKNKK